MIATVAMTLVDNSKYGLPEVNVGLQDTETCDKGEIEEKL